MRGSSGGYSVEDLAHFGGLVFRPSPDRGAATNCCILFLNFGGAAKSNEGPKVGLERAKGN